MKFQSPQHQDRNAFVLSDREEEGIWRHHFTGETIDPSVGGTVDGGDLQNCGALIPPWDGWHDWACRINSEVSVAQLKLQWLDHA